MNGDEDQLDIGYKIPSICFSPMSAVISFTDMTLVNVAIDEEADDGEDTVAGDGDDSDGILFSKV